MILRRLGAELCVHVANGHNSIGRFYETFGNGGADTADRQVTPNPAVIGFARTRHWPKSNGRCATT